MGDTAFVSPLYKWTKKDVHEALQEYGLDVDIPETEDTGNLSMCHKCLGKEKEVFCPKEGRNIPTVKWSPDENLRSFFEAYNFV